MTEAREKKRKLTLVGVTFGLCITIMLTGTFAWQSISQYAKNEAMGEMSNPGGRLHDDFNFNAGGNKDIYIENFTSQADGMPIIVRIRLYEYMEIGEDAGKNLEDADRDVTVKSGAGADINAPLTWDIFKPGDTHYDCWDWTLGGQTVYMPTFDKNKDSKDADINGSYEGVAPGDAIHYDDYISYALGDKLTGIAKYDADDDNDTDEGNVTQVTEEHIAKETIAGTVMNMDDWVAAGAELGNYWVYDTDGWAYWANPLMPDTATGLLLSQIQLKETMTEKWYYGIYVESQMVTADEIADVAAAKAGKKGFYHKHTEDGDGNCTDNECPGNTAQTLLSKIVAEIGYTASGDTSGANINSNETNGVSLTSLEVTDDSLATAQKVDGEETENNPAESDETGEDDENADGEETDGSQIDDENSNDSDILDGDTSKDEVTGSDKTGDTMTGNENNTTGGEDVGNTTTGTENNTTSDTDAEDTTTGNDTTVADPTDKENCEPTEPETKTTVTEPTGTTEGAGDNTKSGSAN